MAVLPIRPTPTKFQCVSTRKSAQFAHTGNTGSSICSCVRVNNSGSGGAGDLSFGIQMNKAGVSPATKFRLNPTLRTLKSKGQTLKIHRKLPDDALKSKLSHPLDPTLVRLMGKTPNFREFIGPIALDCSRPLKLWIRSINPENLKFSNSKRSLFSHKHRAEKATKIAYRITGIQTFWIHPGRHAPLAGAEGDQLDTL